MLHADDAMFFLTLNVVVFRWFCKAVSVVSIPQNFTIQSLISNSLNLTRKAIAIVNVNCKGFPIGMPCEIALCKKERINFCFTVFLFKIVSACRVLMHE